MRAILLGIFYLASNMAQGSDQISFQGKLIIKQENHQALFKLIKKSKYQYLLEITLPQTKSTCFFSVQRISAPQQTKGRDGIVYANRGQDCRFKGASKNESDFWNSIKLLDISYRMQDRELLGTAKLSSLQNSYPADLNFD
jgi:hypothetical protein